MSYIDTDFFPLFFPFFFLFYLQIISYDSPRGGVSVITEKGETTTSFLLIQSARPQDSGQYQCNPSNAKSKSVTVHVLNGKYDKFVFVCVSHTKSFIYKVIKCRFRVSIWYEFCHLMSYLWGKCRLISNLICFYVNR